MPIQRASCQLARIGTNLLADRLKYLGEMGPIRQREPEDGSKVRRYELTAFTATTDARTFVEIGAGVLSPLDAALTQRLIMVGDKDAVIRCTELLGLTSRMSPSKNLKITQLA